MHCWDLGESRREEEGREGGGQRYLKSIIELFIPGVLPVAGSCCPLTRDTIRLLAKGCRGDLSLLELSLLAKK